VKTYRDLLVWQKAMIFVTDIYQTTRAFPREELYGLTSQMRRCAVSIPSNIAEGYGRNSTSDYIRFLQIASGSLYELQTQLEISANLEYLDKNDRERLDSLSREIERMLSSLIHKIR
jgi:four helix bundle protein